MENDDLKYKVTHFAREKKNWSCIVEIFENEIGLCIINSGCLSSHNFFRARSAL